MKLKGKHHAQSLFYPLNFYRRVISHQLCRAACQREIPRRLPDANRFAHCTTTDRNRTSGSCSLYTSQRLSHYSSTGAAVRASCAVFRLRLGRRILVWQQFALGGGAQKRSLVKTAA